MYITFSAIAHENGFIPVRSSACLPETWILKTAYGVVRVEKGWSHRDGIDDRNCNGKVDAITHLTVRNRSES